MKAAFVKTKNRVEIRSLPLAGPGPGQVLVKVEACGVCGSDFIEASHWAGKWKRFGHEVVGVVRETGPDATEVRPGDRVVLSLSAPCGRCAACLAGHPRHCTGMITATQGGFGEYLLVEDERLLVRISDRLPRETACLAEPVSVILDGFHLAGLGPEDSLVVAGGGFLGLLGALLAQAMGVGVTAVLNRRLDQGLESLRDAIGFQYLKWPKPGLGMGPAGKALQQALGSHPGRTVVLHTAPPAAISSYLDLLPYSATVVNIGLSGNKKENRLCLDAARSVFKRTQLLSGFPVPCLHMEEAVDLVEKNAPLLAKLETRSIALEELPALFKKPRRPGKHIVVFED